MSQLKDQLGSNLAAVDGRIRRAAERCGRSPNEITLVVVTKYAPDAAVRLLPEFGRVDLGENRPQQLVRRANLVPSASWHLIGRLQTNKVRTVLSHTVLIHSVDSLNLLERIGATAAELGMTSEVLLEVNISGEPTKQGFVPEQLRAAWDQCLRIPNVSIHGLMAMAPFSDDVEVARPVFRGLREFRDDLRERAGSMVERHPLRDLSMGMSGDFEVAIEEGATLIRVGSAVFDNIQQ